MSLRETQKFGFINWVGKVVRIGTEFKKLTITHIYNNFSCASKVR